MARQAASRRIIFADHARCNLGSVQTSLGQPQPGHRESSYFCRAISMDLSYPVHPEPGGRAPTNTL